MNGYATLRSFERTGGGNGNLGPSPVRRQRAIDHTADLARVSARVHGTIDRNHSVRTDVALFNSVRLDLELEGVSELEAEELVEAFKGR